MVTLKLLIPAVSALLLLTACGKEAPAPAAAPLAAPAAAPLAAPAAAPLAAPAAAPAAAPLAAPAAAPAAAKAFKDCADCPEMVVIPAGSFEMGGTGSREKPVHRVTLR